MINKTNFYFDEHCLWHHSSKQYAGTLPVGLWVQPASSSGLAESPESKRRFKNLMDLSNLTEQITLKKGLAITEKDLLRVHPQHYLKRFKALSDQGGGELDVGVPIGADSYEIAKLSVGLATAALCDVLLGKADNAYALSRPPGHHCLKEKAMGFCMFANIAIAIEYAKVYLDLQRVLVLDWDVHHGNGTQEIFYDRADVYTISMHQEYCFPAGYHGAKDRGVNEGLGYNLNIPLPAGSGHDTYLYAIDTLVIPEIVRYQPNIIIIACGFDANAFDPLARMQLHSDSYREMTAKILDIANQVCEGKVVMLHEGGYSESYVPFCGHAVVETLVNYRTEVIDPVIDFIKLQQPKGSVQEFYRQLIDEQQRQL